MNGAPDWQDGECCFRCRTQFTLMARKHHCRNCGNIFCAKCSSQQIPLPKLNIDKNVRVCDTCFDKLDEERRRESAVLDAIGVKDPNTRESAKTMNSPSMDRMKSAMSSDSSASKQSKPAASASAPSEQELKEEEEFQLALALSLSETPTKVSFPEVRNYEQPKNTPIQKSTSNVPDTTVPINNNSPTSNGTVAQRATSSQPEAALPAQLEYPAVSQAQMPSMVAMPPPSIDYSIPERDRELFRFVGEVQSTLEVFNNRLESCKLRNRPVANDAAIQSLFIRLNSEVQPKLADYIKTYDNERADYERIQDKLSQIADARAALDALREEHQEKMREQAAEAERLRQTQLATKLEAMRQKKSQMMQYQRELALQRIKEQEQQQQQQYQTNSAQGYQVPPVTAHPDNYVNQPVANHVHQDWHHHQQQAPEQHYTQPANYVAPQTSQHYQPSNTHVTHIPQQQYTAPSTSMPSISGPMQGQQQPAPPPSIDRASLAQLERQFLPPQKPDEDTPLISFDD